MAVYVENLGGGGGTAPAPPIIPPETQGTVVVDELSGNYAGPLAPYWSQAYIGADAFNAGLTLQRANEPYGFEMDVVPNSINAAGLLFWAWPLAWYTQVRHHHQAVTGLWVLNPFQAISCLTCFSGNTASGGQCYALTAYNPGFGFWTLTMERWSFPFQPQISSLIREPLLDCGTVAFDSRIFLFAQNAGATWNLVAIVVSNATAGDPWVYERRGNLVGLNDPGIQAGMPAFAAMTLNNSQTFTFRGAVVAGWGPNDVPWPIP